MGWDGMGCEFWSGGGVMGYGGRVKIDGIVDEMRN